MTTTDKPIGIPIQQPESEYCYGKDCMLLPGNTNCGGCGMGVAYSLLGRVMDELDKPSTLVIPACCGIVAAGGFPSTTYHVPTIAATFGSSPAFGSGVAAVRDMNDDKEEVICWAGDGGTFDIGMAALSGAAERNDNILYVCYDNEIYGNTGGQRSSASPEGARTSTTPFGKHEGKKDIMGIMAAHHIPYAATLSIAHPDDFRTKVRTALSIKGFRFLLIHSPCPTGWKSEPGDSIHLVRVAVQSGLFPLFEVFGGKRYRVNAELTDTDPYEYHKRQKRFPKGNLDMDQIRADCKESHDRLKKLQAAFPANDDE